MKKTVSEESMIEKPTFLADGTEQKQHLTTKK